MLGLKSSLLLNTFKNETSVINELKTTQDNLVIQSNNNTSDISDNQALITTNTNNITTNSNAITTNATNITTNSNAITTNSNNITTNTNSISAINNKFQLYYQTLIFRNKYDNNNRFSNYLEVESFNKTINNPENSNKFSIIDKSSDIKGDDNLFVYKVKVHSYTSVNPDSGTTSLHEANKDIVVFGQAYSPLFSVVGERGDDICLIASHGLFRNSHLLGGIKRSDVSPSQFGYDHMFGATATGETTQGIGQIADGYNYYLLQCANDSNASEDQIYYYNPIVEIYQISKTNYERSTHIGTDTISAPLTGISLHELNYLV